MKKLSVFIFLSLLLLPLSAKGKKEPVWVNRAYDGYDQSKYIAACGSGKSQDEAGKSAAAAVSSIIRQNVNAEEYVNQSFSSKNEDFSTYLTNISTSTNITDISGLSIKDRWRSADGTYYARAVLDKNAAGKYYSLLISKKTIEIETLKETALSKPNTFEACANMIKAYKTAKENDSYIELLSVIKPEIKKVLSYGSSAEIAAETQKVFGNVTVLINVSGDSDSRVANAAGAVMNGMGISTAPASFGKDNVQYVFLADLALEDVDRPSDSDIYFTRYILTCTLTETATGKDLLNYSATGRQGKLSRNESQQSAVRAAENSIRKEFSAKFETLFNTL